LVFVINLYFVSVILSNRAVLSYHK